MYWKMSNRYIDDVYNLAKSFSYAFRGFRFAVDNERNMRIHLTMTILVIEFAVLYQVKAYEYMILCLLFGLVLTAEMINTAIEALVNLNTSGYDTLARIAKDVAAGAVLVLAVTSAVVGVLIFGNLEKLQACGSYLLEHPVLILLAVAELVIAWLFIFRWNSRRAVRRKYRDK